MIHGFHRSRKDFHWIIDSRGFLLLTWDSLLTGQLLVMNTENQVFKEKKMVQKYLLESIYINQHSVGKRLWSGETKILFFFFCQHTKSSIWRKCALFITQDYRECFLKPVNGRKMDGCEYRVHSEGRFVKSWKVVEIEWRFTL